MVKLYRAKKSAEEEIACLTFDQLMKFIENKLPEKDRTRVEVHLRACEFCREAVLGTRTANKKVRQIVKSLNQEIQSRAGLPIRQDKSWRFYYALAAVLVIGIASVFYWSKEKPNELLFKQYFQPYPSITPVTRGDQPAGKLAEALILYETGDFAEALKLFSSILSSDPKNLTVHFYTGISHLSLNDLNHAIIHLQKVRAGEQSTLLEPALWYLGLAYLKKNDLKNAKFIFNNLSASDGYYKKQAEELLKSLE